MADYLEHSERHRNHRQPRDRRAIDPATGVNAGEGVSVPPRGADDAPATPTKEIQMNVIIVMSEAATRAVLRAVEDDPDRSKWGHHQWVRSEAIHALSASLVRPEDALAKALYRMNGSAWYGRDLGDWDDPESRIGRNSAERDRWYRQADALLVVELRNLAGDWQANGNSREQAQGADPPNASPAPRNGARA